MVSAIGSSGSTTAAQDRASVSREQFLQLLVAELTSQDPMEPVSNSQFLDQLVGLQTLEQTSALTDGLSSFQSFMEMSYGSSLIGKAVKAMGGDGTMVEGVVQKVVLENGKVFMVVGDQKLSVGAIREVLAPPAG